MRRRDLLKSAAFGAAAATLGAGEAVAQTPATPGTTGNSSQSRAPLSVPENGQYATVPLRKDALRVTAVQSVIRPVRNTLSPATEVRRNVDHMVEFIDGANGFGGKQDLVCFHEQPISGWAPWNRTELLRVCIEVPGPETEAIGKVARRHGCYVTFGAYVRDKYWPGHVLLNGILIGPDGNVVASHWKTNNTRGFMPGYDIFTTSIYDVLDRYREMYGEDAVLPIARTDIGNISCSITPGQGDVMRAHAMKGLELRLSAASGGYNIEETGTVSYYNRLYTVVVNQAISPDNPGFPEFSGSGDTAIFGPNGRIVARARSANEEFVTAVIPIAEFRRTRALPDVPMEMLLPVYAKYRPRYGANLQADYLPLDGADASKYFASKRRW